MKTKVRTQVYKNQNGCYEHMSIQILTPRYKGARYLEQMGEITFQRNIDDKDGYRWYGMDFSVTTNKFEYLKKMAALAEYIQKNKSSYAAQPEEIKHLIGAEEHIFFDSEFVPVTDKGKSIFKVIKTGNLYDKITAPNEIVANKILEKKNIAGATLEFHKVIDF
jgi:hypothetical protein